jgi:hypothetical protein
MFGWLKKTTNKQVPPETFANESTSILGIYTSILHSYPHHLIDESWLPANKETMARLFRLILTSEEQYPNEAHRERTEAYWRALSLFQPGVGSVPIDTEISKDNPTVAVWRERAARAEVWLDIAIAEGERYEREIERLGQQRRR